MICGIQRHQVVIKFAQLKHLPPDTGVVQVFVRIAGCNGGQDFLGANQSVFTVAHNPATGCTGGNIGDGERGDIVQIQHTGGHVAHQAAGDGAGEVGNRNGQVVACFHKMPVVIGQTQQAAGGFAVQTCRDNSAIDQQMYRGAFHAANEAANMQSGNVVLCQAGNAGKGNIGLLGASRGLNGTNHAAHVCKFVIILVYGDVGACIRKLECDGSRLRAGGAVQANHTASRTGITRTAG